MNGLLLQFDGGAPSTGGDGGFGAVLFWPDGEIMDQLHGYLGSNVNHHICEYCGLIYGVRLAREYAPATLRIIGDSMMVVKQVTGAYRVRGDHLAVLHAAAVAELAALARYVDDRAYEAHGEQGRRQAGDPCAHREDAHVRGAGRRSRVSRRYKSLRPAPTSAVSHEGDGR